MTSEVETLRKNRMILAVELDGRTQGRQGAEAEQLALQKKIENTAFRLQALRSAWRILAQDRPWSNEALSELSARLLRENSDLLQVEQLIDQSERLTESAASLGEIAQLQAELAPIELERDRLNGYALAAEATQTAYQKKRQQHVRQQMEEFVRVISALFTRMQANEVYDKIMEGDASAPLSWRAISEGLAMNPDLRFSQGQRQDFALAIFLARARGLSGTFFLDEPLVHLDDLNRVALLDVFRAICLERAGNVSFVLTTASQPTLRHFVEKFARVSQSSPGHDNRTPVLRVVSLEGNPRAGVSFS
jgi:DNA repair protein SbcC/Rad50